jgi:tetrahydromethanopterin S-methyltransferase subunit A
MSERIPETERESALATVGDQFAAAVTAPKCHGCGCLSGTIEAMEKALPVVPDLAPVLAKARAVLKPKKYDCLGCEICFPAVAANAFAEAFPDAMPDGALCPTEAPGERSGWPPLPGEYSVLRYGASVAVCTLNSEELSKELVQRAPEGLAIVGTMHTENLGIERVIRNVLANPNLRWLILCGDDTRQLVGHLPGQSMQSLFANGLDEKQRIVGAKGKRPILKNVTPDHVRVFREQVQLVAMIGEQNADRVAERVEELQSRAAPAFAGTFTDVAVETVHAKEPQFYKSDPAGFFVVYPNRQSHTLVVEHYTNAGVLDSVVEGATPTSLYAEIVKRSLVSQLDHAAYLGRELAMAERSLTTGETYVQDRAPGQPLPLAASTEASTTCGPGCATCH